MVNSAQIIPVNIEDEMRSSYLDYAMSVIIGRALPDIRDGLKPAHRRILYAMYSEGLLSNKKYTKCASVVGEVLKKYHPHGDAAVYDTLVRMAQDWNMRYPLIDGQGNFGSVDGDSAAAYRYTEARLAKLAEELLGDIEKETVDFVPNFDESTFEPVVLPSRVPNLLVNGSDGIAVGMATKMAPHNLTEVCSATIALIKNPELTIKDLMKFIPGPDFPTGAYIHGREGILQAYETGKGIIRLRAKVLIEPISRGDREAIVITEIPYQVNKARLVEQIANLVQSGKVEGISDLRDESDRDGNRIVVDLKKGTVAGVVLNCLYKHTPLQDTFGINMLAIVNGQPRTLSLKQILQLFIEHRKEVVTRRTIFDLKQAEARAHILEGLKKALENIDEVIALIKKSKSPEEAKFALMKKFSFSEIQSQAILDMRLQKLTNLEQNKILEEYKELMGLIKKLKGILADEALVMEIITEETEEIKKKYGDERRTEIQARSDDLTVEDMIQEEDMVVTVSHFGYIKRSPISIYRAQKRGGKGKVGMSTGDEDFVESLFVASTHNYVMVFTESGKCYWLKVHEIPQIGRTARGKAITNLIQMSSNDRIAAILPVKKFEEGQFIVMATKKGLLKKTSLMEYSSPRASGIVASKVEDGDRIVSVRLTNGQHDIFISTKEGQSIRFKEVDARPTGRATYGVWGIKLAKGDEVVSMDTLSNENPILTVTEKGYGKRTAVKDYRLQGRGGSGTIAIKVTDKNGPVVGVMQVADTDDVMIVTNKGQLIRTKVKNISTIGRNTQGVRLISIASGEKVSSVAKLAEKEE